MCESPILLGLALSLFVLSLKPASGEEESVAGKAKPAEPSTDLKTALDRLDLPGVAINLEEWSVDVESRICLRQGPLELIACTKGTKEHESIVTIEAKPSHIHAALLLIGAVPGQPATRRRIEGEESRFVDLPPRGGAVDVSLVILDDEKTERPINEFIAPIEETGRSRAPGESGNQKFPTHTFLFAGSILSDRGEGRSRYMCDQTGNVISISTFGDELLCLPGLHSHSNGMLGWQVDAGKLPEVGTKVILRLRPKIKRKPAAAADGEKPGDPE